jgi:hypothetical protein
MGIADAMPVPELEAFSADVLSATGDVGMPAGEPIEEGRMKSSRFMKSFAEADVVVLAAVVTAI